MLLHSALKKLSEQFWHKIILPVPLILTYLLTYLVGPRSFAKKSNSKNVKTSKHHPKVHTLHLERGWDHFPDPSFSESSFKLLGKIGYSTRDFQTIWRLRVSPCLMCGVLGPLPKGQNGAKKKVGSLQVTEKRQTRSLEILGPFPLFLDWCYLVVVSTLCHAVCRESCSKTQILLLWSWWLCEHCAILLDRADFFNRDEIFKRVEFLQQW